MRFLLLLVALSGVAAAQNVATPNDVFPVFGKATDGSLVLDLHQGGCYFPAAEAEPPFTLRGNTPEDCERINRVSLDIRKKGFKRMRLKAGKYIIRVFNDGAPWATGFWLRGATDLSLPNFKAEGIATGQGKETLITLTPGLYVYSDPVAHTPDYSVLVER